MLPSRRRAKRTVRGYRELLYIYHSVSYLKIILLVGLTKLRLFIALVCCL